MKIFKARRTPPAGIPAATPQRSAPHRSPEAQRCGSPYAARLPLLAGLLLLAAGAVILAPSAAAQGSRKDDIVLGPTGHPIPGATVTVCQAAATGTPCSPLATIYTDATLTVTATNPLQTDGLGNYHFYAPSGRYMIQISGPSITGTLTYPDVILASDASSPTLSSLTVTGNATIGGSATVAALNKVQKADQFSGSDAAAKINACLTAASTSSGLCDARGLTGTLTATSHIQIPAATTLLWGPAQLTVNDTTNHDAVELLGDGSTLIGYQESGSGTVPRPDSSGFIACQPTGCTTVKNPNAATRNVDWVHITGMNLQATGSGSTVLNLTSVSHADIENNRFIMGTGGSSYGIFGDTSTGGFDSTNTLIKHNEFDPQYQNDRCLRLAGVFNVIEMEQNTCILPASNTGTVCFEIAKDSNNNYPNNDEFYGNDCEGSSTSFGQIGYNIINAD